ncbi:MAG: alpha/beta hydrolase [Sulfitobacter sp.]
MEKRFLPAMMMAQEELDFQLSPSLSAKDAQDSLTGMVTRTVTASKDPSLTFRADVAYGPDARQRFDVFSPSAPGAPARPCLVFLHGGFWQEGDKSVSGFAAQTFAALGWACVSVGYTLTPQATLTEIVTEVSTALHHIHTHAGDLGIDPERIVLAGHSAGAHLAACILTNATGSGCHTMLAGAVLISGVYELAPIARSYVNDLARISEHEVTTLSPARLMPGTQMPVHLLIGADEPEAFQLQTDVLADVWRPAAPRLSVHRASGRDHFDVLEELNTAGSPTLERIQMMI